MSEKKASRKPADAKDSVKSARSTTKRAASRPSQPQEKVDGETAVLATIAAMPESDRVLGERLHAIIMAAAPALTPRLWYGMPAYARSGKVVCFFQGAGKFKTRYATLGFMHEANLDDGAHVADRLRSEGVDGRRGSQDRRPREEGGELRQVFPSRTRWKHPAAASGLLTRHDGQFQRVIWLIPCPGSPRGRSHGSDCGRMPRMRRADGS